MDIYDEILGEYEGDTTKSPIATILNDIREAEKRNQVPLERFTKVYPVGKRSYFLTLQHSDAVEQDQANYGKEVFTLRHLANGCSI